MSCWDANLSHFRLYWSIIILIFRVPKPLFPLTVLLTLLRRVVLYISWLLIAYFSAHFYHYKELHPPDPNSVDFCFHSTRNQAGSEAFDLYLEDRRAVFVGLDDQSRLCLLPYGLIFQLSQWPEGWTSFSVIILCCVILYSESPLMFWI